MALSIVSKIIRFVLFTAIFALGIIGFTRSSEAQTVDKDNKPAEMERKFTPEEALARFTVNVTAYANSPQARPFIGNSTVIREAVETMDKGGNKLLYLTGPAGSGKTALVEAMSKALVGRTIYSLKQNALEAGTGVKGTEEQRLQSILEAFANRPDRVLFIDEAHSIMENEKLVQILKPALGRGEIICIMATTDDEYRSDIEGDPALTSRGNRKQLQSPTEAEIVSALRGAKEMLEAHHGIPVTDSALKLAAKYTLRYYPSEPAYRKALDLVDRTMAREVINKKLGNYDNLHLHDQKQALELERSSLQKDFDRGIGNPEDIKDRLNELKDELAALDARLEVLNGQDYINSLHDRLGQLQKESADAKAKGDLQRFTQLELIIQRVDTEMRSAAFEPQTTQFISEDHIAKFIGQDRGIPVGNLRETEAQRARRLEDLINSRVKGQPQAAHVIANSNKIALANVDVRRGARDVILMAGPPGIGKNETVETMAIGIFNDIRKVVRIDMGQMGANAAMQITGSGPGLVNNEKGGLLEPIRLDGYVILNLDELDKADRSIDNLLIAALDLGETKDAMGRTIDFRNTVVVITANWAEEYALNKDVWSLRQVEAFYKLPMGSLDGLRQEEIDQIVIDRAMELSGVSGALRSRIRTKILMNKITLEQAVEIARVKLADQADYVFKEHKVTLRFDPKDSVAQAIARAGYNEQYGARSIDKSRRDAVSTMLAEIQQDPNLGFHKNDVIDIKFVTDADGKGGRMVFERAGTELAAKTVLFRTVHSPKAELGKVEGEAGKSIDMNEIFASTKRMIEKAKGHVK